MALLKIKKTKPVEEVEQTPPTEETKVEAKQSYEATHLLNPLCLAAIIVNNGQAEAVNKILYKAGASFSVIGHGNGTAPSRVYEVLGVSNELKRIIYSPMTFETWLKVKPLLIERFSVSKFAKGLALLIPLTSICGVSAYKFLTNTRNLETGKGVKEMDLSTVQPGFEVVMAIVNDGFTDLVMEAAKKAGARGGTILQARGTGNKEIEQFFGVRITPEKQIVMIIVPKDIRDEVLRLIYEAAGLNTKGQGIAFSFATSDVVGIQTENKEVTSGEVK